MKKIHYFISTMMLAASFSVYSAEFKNTVESDYVIKDFVFHDGTKLDQLNIHYTTIGNPSGKPVLILHGTAGTGKGMLNDKFGEALFGKGMALDAEKYFIILPDSIGTGKSSKPSDKLKGNFPQYNYLDSVNAQHTLLKDKLNIDKLYLIIGNSMGGMQTWEWLTNYPDYVTAAIPMAATPIPMSSRNWIMRKMFIDAIKNDPDWKNGFYEKQPEKFQQVYNYFKIATNGGDIDWQNKAYNVAETERILKEKLSERVTMDANDFLYQWNSARDFDPTDKLNKVKSHVMAVNSADDERNPVSTQAMEKAISGMKNVQYYLIPASDKSSGHATTANAALWRDQLTKFLATLPE